MFVVNIVLTGAISPNCFHTFFFNSGSSVTLSLIKSASSTASNGLSVNETRASAASAWSSLMSFDFFS